MNGNLVSDLETAGLLGVSRGTLANWRCQRTQGPAFVKVGRLVRYRLADVEAWLARNTVDPMRGQIGAE
jgi:predicted DNA-binding transcriptional regulator AlpA